MSKHVPDTAAANAALDTAREPSRRDHLPCQVRHLDEIDWETIRCRRFMADQSGWLRRGTMERCT